MAILTTRKHNPKSLKKAKCWDNRKKNNEEFAHAGRCGKNMRDAITATLFRCCGVKKVHFLATQLYKNLRDQDKLNEWGKRRINHNELYNYLHGLELGDKNSFDSTFLRDCEHSFYNGTWRIVYDQHNPTEDIAAPSGATHYSFASAMIMRTAANEGYCAIEKLEPIGVHSLSNDNVDTLIFTLPTPPQAVGNLRIFVAAIHFWRYENGEFIEVERGFKNAAKIIGIENN